MSRTSCHASSTRLVCLAQSLLPVDSFIAFLRAAPNDMPSFSADVLSDQDAADIHAYLGSLPGRKPVKDFPLLNQ